MINQKFLLKEIIKTIPDEQNKIKLRNKAKVENKKL